MPLHVVLARESLGALGTPIRPFAIRVVRSLMGFEIIEACKRPVAPRVPTPETADGGLACVSIGIFALA